jgi:tRNA(fMet)-specific endonuclease VapC
MENRRVLIDTSIVIEYLRSQNRKVSAFVKLFKDNDLCISAISIFELYNGATNESKKQDIEILCYEIENIDFDINTAKTASEIYRNLRSKNKIIEFRDILISATAIQYNLPIATLNVKHFEQIENLQLVSLK